MRGVPSHADAGYNAFFLGFDADQRTVCSQSPGHDFSPASIDGPTDVARTGSSRGNGTRVVLIPQTRSRWLTDPEVGMLPDRCVKRLVAV